MVSAAYLFRTKVQHLKIYLPKVDTSFYLIKFLDRDSKIYVDYVLTIHSIIRNILLIGLCT